MTGTLLAIARRAGRRAPMEEIAGGAISLDRGLEGDVKGAKFPRRQITILALEDWLAANADLGIAPPLAWTVRRANLLIEGMALPRARGAGIEIGTVRLEVTGQTVPCRRMDDAHQGLLRALFADWRGGVTCRVVEGGEIAIGDSVAVEMVSPTPRPRLPQ